jgi:serine/threonine-protein kinase
MGMDPELKARADARIGTTIREKYRIDALLGIGGMAAVYKATHRNRAEFAIKMLHPELSMREGFRQRFLREGYAANSVKHPGVVAVVDDDVTEDGSAFLVMELLIGTSVHELAKAHGKRLSIPAACAVLDQLLDALAAAHTAGIVHRDIKPANLFITTDGTLKVLDFGIARVREGMTGDTSATGTGVLLGTPGFMAPEQAKGDQDAIDARTDLWAAGATFFTLVSGKFVHSGGNAAQLMVSAATTMARSVRAVADVPPEIGSVIDRALDFDVQSRWSSATEMQRALRAAVEQTFGTHPPRTVLAEWIAAPTDQASLRTLPTPASAPSSLSGPSSPATVLTGNGVSSTMASLPHPPSSSTSRVVTFAALAVIAVAGIVGYKQLTHRDPPQPAAAVVDTEATATTPRPTATTAATVTDTADTAATDPRKPTTPSHAGGGKRLPPAPPASQAPGVRPQARTLSGCEPPYFFDADNNKIFKKECL